MTEKEYLEAFDDVIAKLKKTTDEKEKERLKTEFWRLAIDSFNELIAGDIVTVTGKVLHTPKIEL